MKIALIPTLTEPLLQKAISKGADTILASQIEVSLSKLPAHITLIDAKATYLIPASWVWIKENKSFLNLVLLNNKNLFFYKNINLYNSFLKSFFWVFYTDPKLTVKTSLEVLRTTTDHIDIVLDTGIGSIKFYLKQVTKGLINYLKPRKARPYQPLAVDIEKKYVFWITDSLEAWFWSRLITVMPPHEVLVILATTEEGYQQISNSLYYQEWLTLGVRIENIGLPEKRIFVRNFLYQSILPNKNINLYNNILEMYDEAIDYIEWFNSIMNCIKTKVIIVNCMEINWKGNIICEIAHKKGVKVFNTANGLHTPLSGRSGTEFDTWAVWDEPTRNLLVDQCQVPTTQVKNIGCHLGEDFLQDYQYAGTLPSLDFLRGKKIILFCGTIGFSLGKKQALETVYELLLLHPDWIMIYRPHPFESDADFLMPPTTHPAFDRVIVSTYARSMAKESLYDQLLVCHVAVVLGSTIALEARNMGVKTISYELSSPPFIYFADNQNIFLANTPMLLNQQLSTIVPTATAKTEIDHLTEQPSATTCTKAAQAHALAIQALSPHDQ